MARRKKISLARWTHEFFGPGWRMYYARRGDILILMQGGGTKATQERDIAKAIALAETIEE